MSFWPVSGILDLLTFNTNSFILTMVELYNTSPALARILPVLKYQNQEHKYCFILEFVTIFGSNRSTSLVLFLGLWKLYQQEEIRDGKKLFKFSRIVDRKCSKSKSNFKLRNQTTKKTKHFRQNIFESKNSYSNTSLIRYDWLCCFLIYFIIKIDCAFYSVLLKNLQVNSYFIHVL